MKVLVTGATGFIGNHVINQLLSIENIEIIATSRDKNKIHNFHWSKKVTYIEYDVELYSSDCNLYNYFNKPDILIHLAWGHLASFKDMRHIEISLFKHYMFLQNLISNGLTNINVVGTCLEYGLQQGCLEEQQCTMPSLAYAVAKDSLRKFMEELHKHISFDLKWIRLFYMYGKGQSQTSLISQLDKAVAEKQLYFNMSGGEQIRDFLPIQNVAEYVATISVQTRSSGIINCCSGKPISVKNFIENYIKNKNYSIKLNLGYYSYPDYEPMSFWGNNSKLIEIMKNNNR